MEDKVSMWYGDMRDKRSHTAKRDYVRCLLREKNLNLCRQRHLVVWGAAQPQTFRQKQFVRFG